MPKTALQVKTTGEVVMLDLTGDELATLQGAVGGWVEAINFTNSLTMWCNEEGKLDGLSQNIIAQHFYDNAYGAGRDIIVGDVVFTGGTDDEGDTVSLREELVKDIHEVAERLARSAVFITKEETKKVMSWQDHLGDAPMTEENVWQAIADANDLDYDEIADGDLFEWL
jgi:hypothetical protein